MNAEKYQIITHVKKSRNLLRIQKLYTTGWFDEDTWTGVQTAAKTLHYRSVWVDQRLHMIGHTQSFSTAYLREILGESIKGRQYNQRPYNIDYVGPLVELKRQATTSCIHDITAERIYRNPPYIICLCQSYLILSTS